MTTLSAEVAEAVRLRDAATPGQWTWVDRELYPTPHTCNEDCLSDIQYHCYLGGSILRLSGACSMEEADCALIAAAPSHVDLIERLFAQLEQARVEIEQWKKRSRANWDAARNLADVALKP